MGMSSTEFQILQMRLAAAAGRKSIVQPSIYDESEDESELHNQVLEYCKSRGWLVFHGSMAHKTKRTPGEPDIVLIANDGRVFFVELKKKNGKESPAQIGVRLQAEKLGTKIHVVKSIEQFIDIVSTKTQP